MENDEKKRKTQMLVSGRDVSAPPHPVAAPAASAGVGVAMLLLLLFLVGSVWSCGAVGCLCAGCREEKKEEGKEEKEKEK